MRWWWAAAPWGRRGRGVDTRVVPRTTVIESNLTAPLRCRNGSAREPGPDRPRGQPAAPGRGGQPGPGGLGSVDLVIECIPERLDIKQAPACRRSARPRAPRRHPGQQQLQLPDQRHRPGLDTRERMLGLHFFMPAHLVPLVEVVMADTSDEASADALIAFMKRCGSVPVKVRQDLPGFLANRLQHALSREAFDLIDRGIASPEDVDAAVRFAASASWRPWPGHAARPCRYRSARGRRRHHVPLHVLQRGPPRALPGRARRRWPPRHEDRRRLLRLTPETIAAERARATTGCCAPWPGPDRARTAGDPAMTHAADPRPQAPRLPLAESPSSSPWRPTAPHKAGRRPSRRAADGRGVAARRAPAWTPARP